MKYDYQVGQKRRYRSLRVRLAEEQHSEPGAHQTRAYRVTASKPVHAKGERWTKQIGARIREARELRGLSVFELARRTNLQSTAIARYERGAAPGVKALWAIANALQIDPRELMP